MVRKHRAESLSGYNYECGLKEVYSFSLLDLAKMYFVPTAVKNPLATQETLKMQVQSLGWEDLLECEMATYSYILPWKTPWTEEPVRLKSMGSQRGGHGCAWVRTHAHTHMQNSIGYYAILAGRMILLSRGIW